VFNLRRNKNSECQELIYTTPSIKQQFNEAIEKERKKFKPMRVIVNGKLFDSEKAEFVGDNICSIIVNMGYLMEYEYYRIYRTKKGYYKTVDGEVKEYTEEGIKALLETDVERYIEFFGEPEEA